MHDKAAAATPVVAVGSTPVETSVPSAQQQVDLVDSHGRIGTDLRVSLTDRCNLRCVYCMPEEGLDWLPGDEVLTDDELVRLITIAVQRLGVTDVRFTGGEPLLRKGLEDIVAATAALVARNGKRPRMSLTTNALGLEHRAHALAAAGIDRVNISLDTLQPERYRQLNRRDRWHDVIAGLAAAEAAGLNPIKVNAVLMRGINDDEAADLLEWTISKGYQLRFIEQMPLGPHGTWQKSDFITAADMFTLLSSDFTLTPRPKHARGNAPAEIFEAEGRGVRGTVGIIASVTQPFCGDCNRVRLTADGQMRNCLFAREEHDLRAALRSGASDDAIVELWKHGMWVKRAGHGIDDPSFLQPQRPMSAIGG